MQQLQDSVDRITVEKRELESQAAEQAETCHQLTESNNALSARTLALAEEAAAASDAVRRQLDETKKQLEECKTQLRKAEEEIEGLRAGEQSQSIALLDELNSLQTENGNLRAQLRSIKRSLDL
jgi:chromosome segregation ATPase